MPDVTGFRFQRAYQTPLNLKSETPYVMVHFELYSDISGISQEVLTLRQYFSGKIRYCSALTMGDFRAYEYKNQ